MNSKNNKGLPFVSHRDINTSGQLEETQEGKPEAKENPEDITPERWLAMFNTLNSTLAGLQEEIRDLKSIKGTVTALSSWKDGIATVINDYE